jgi:uncharacterized protein (TIGR02599 family)
MSPLGPISTGGRRRDSFTLVEMLVSMAVLVILLAIIGSVAANTAQAIHVTSGKMNTYAAARSAFDVMNEKIAQATLNTYLDYYGTSPLQTTPSLNTNSFTSFTPLTYGRVSNLQFVVRQNSNPSLTFNTPGTSGSSGKPTYGQEIYFECPAAYSTSSTYQSLQGLLNACGYYVQYCNNTQFHPTMFTPAKWRYRLLQAIEPTDSLSVVANDAIADNTGWTANILNTGTAGTPAPDAVPIADNVIALVIWPRLPVGQDAVGANLAPAYIYDSQSNTAPQLSGSTYSQVPAADQIAPILQVTMIVIDEASAARIDTKSLTPPAQIETALTGKFCDVTKYATDLAAVETSLAGNHIQFEVLNTSIVMRESKWSSQ